MVAVEPKWKLKKNGLKKNSMKQLDMNDDEVEKEEVIETKKPRKAAKAGQFR